MKHTKTKTWGKFSVKLFCTICTEWLYVNIENHLYLIWRVESGFLLSEMVHKISDHYCLATVRKSSYLDVCCICTAFKRFLVYLDLELMSLRWRLVLLSKPVVKSHRSQWDLRSLVYLCCCLFRSPHTWRVINTAGCVTVRPVVQSWFAMHFGR